MFIPEPILWSLCLVIFFMALGLDAKSRYGILAVCCVLIVVGLAITLNGGIGQIARLR